MPRKSRLARVEPTREAFSDESAVLCFIMQARGRSEAAAKPFTQAVLLSYIIYSITTKNFARLACHIAFYHYLCNGIEFEVPFSKIYLLNFPAELLPRKGFNEQKQMYIEAVPLGADFSIVHLGL